MTTAETATGAERVKTAVLYLRVSTKEQAEKNGDAEGSSIPAQRDACRRKAAAEGATVVREFIDSGASARSAARPELQSMLAYLDSNQVDLVIVHKVDRLARDRMDDVTISAAIAAGGARLVSVSENIDESPSGRLLHGIMSSIAEFYSMNLANEVVKGMQQKVLVGGTPGRVPLGYVNVFRIVDGVETRTVALDPERAPLIRWAFDAYATGDWSLRALATELEVRGLTFRATKKHPPRPVPMNRLQRMLRNKYYAGLVSWRGVTYQGNHEPLVDAVLFDTVQQTLDARRTAGDKTFRRDHYLLGSLRCGRCGQKLLYGVSRGRSREYGYFFCAGRHMGRNGCQLRYLPVAAVEEAVSQHWLREQIPSEDIALLEEELRKDFHAYAEGSAAEARRCLQKVHRIRRDRFKWADLVMDGAVPADVARAKQDDLERQLAQAEARVTALNQVDELHRDALAAALRLIANCGEAYQEADAATRRAYNQAWYERLLIDEDDAGGIQVTADRPDLIEALRTAEVRPARGRAKEKTAELPVYRMISRVGGSNVATLVELRGLEPLTPCMPCKCATSCATAPKSSSLAARSGPA